jgi:hypothetical protein
LSSIIHSSSRASIEQSAGEYRVMTDEQLIEELSFPVYHRVSTVIFAPGQFPNSTSVERVTIDPRDLQAAQDRDNQEVDP